MYPDSYIGNKNHLIIEIKEGIYFVDPSQKTIKVKNKNEVKKKWKKVKKK